MLVTTTNRLISKSVREFSTRKIGPEAVAGVAKVREQREKYFKNHTQGAPDPTYLKKPMDTPIAFAAGAGCVLGFGLVLNGLYNMANGINKI